MIEKNEISLEFIKKEPITGSDTGMRYILRRIDDNIEVTVWPEPYALYSTDDALKTTETFPLSPEGRDEAVEWLNSQRQLRKDLWDSVNNKPLSSIM